MKVSILGTEYRIVVKKFADEEAFERRKIDGYCDGIMKEIVIGDMASFPDFEHESADYCKFVQKQVLRHEIVHAFFNESGLEDSAASFEGAWCKFEEMIDWIAIQGPKIYAAWQAAGAV